MPSRRYIEELRRLVGTRLLMLPSVAAVVLNDRRELLLQEKRGESWSLPTGMIEPGETPERAMVREVREETGLIVEPERLLGVFGGAGFRYRYPNGDEVEYTVVLFRCAVVGESAGEVDGETVSLRYFGRRHMPPLALPFPTDVLFDGMAPAARAVDLADVLELLALFERHGLDVTLDGGWAVDALLGEQTRPHDDLDIALPEARVPTLRRVLGERGFREIERDDSRECNFVLEDPRGRQVDVHAYTLDGCGNNLSGIEYEAEHLTGRGVLGGRAVRCIPPEVLVRFHTGYDVDDKDYRDVRRLCERFSVPLPAVYDSFARESDAPTDETRTVK